MWDNSTPLELLKSMPKVLEESHLEKLQRLFEADKDKNQLLSDSDLCGSYAPFCDGCNKEIKCPCAVAYVNYLKGLGYDIDIAEVPVKENSDDLPEETAVKEEDGAKEGKAEPEAKSEKTKIRIAIARRKTQS